MRASHLLLPFALCAIPPLCACVVDGEVLRQDTDAGTGGMPDSCTGLDSTACAQQEQQQACVAIWGTPYVDDPQIGWCLFGNGVEYLGCREAGACSATPNGTTLCDANSEDVWRTDWDCVPAEIDANACQPPVAQAPAC